MTPTQAENLRILIWHMETRCNRTLRMAFYASCGTPACALGEACVVPELRNRGLDFPPCEIPMYQGETDGRGCAFFGLSMKDGERLFGTANSNVWGRGTVSPQEWAVEARKVLSEHGYSMDDGFAAFKAKILIPLVEGAPAWD